MQILATLDSKSILYIFLGGLAGAASWIFYLLVLHYGKVSQVAPIDRLSVVFVIIFAVLFLAEKITLPTALGVSLMTAGAIIIFLA